MNNQFKEDNSLVHQLFQYIFGLYCVVAILVTGIHIFEEYKFTKSSIAKELETYQSIFGPILEQALWNLDRDQIDVATEAVISVPIIVGIKIERFQGKQLIPYINKNSDSGTLTNHEQFSYSFPITYTAPGTRQPLGKVTLYSDTSVVLERLKLGFTFLIINALIKGIALWLIFWWGSKKLLIKPLTSLKKSISSLHFDNLDDINIDLGIKNKNELSVIESSFNTMVNELMHAKKVITDFNNQLEKNVIKRTDELRVAKEIAEKATLAAESSCKAKNEFLSTISHELRTPMNGIQGTMYLLSKTNLDGKQLKYLEMADTCSQQMLQLINNMLDIIKIDNGTLALKISEFDIYSSLEKLYLKEKINNKNPNINFIFDAESLKNTLVIGDKDRIIQIFESIISNALKFTESGQIKIEVHKEEVITPNTKEIRIYASVQDTGIGIEKDKANTLFDSFFVSDSSTNRIHNGTGLGLAISKGLCKIMKGSISVTSKPGEGSIFKFDITLPMAKKHQ